MFYNTNIISLYFLPFQNSVNLSVSLRNLIVMECTPAFVWKLFEFSYSSQNAKQCNVLKSRSWELTQHA